MNFRLSLIALAMFSFGASAAMAVNPMDKVIVKSEQFKGVNYQLEKALGRNLSGEERENLAAALAAESIPQVIAVEDDGIRNTTKSLVCASVGYSAGMLFYRAVCVSLFPVRTYDMAILGVGAALELKASITRLTFSYNGDRYAKDFDPIPGKYGVVSMGATGLVGLTFYGGDSGNKSVSGQAVNFGGGGDLGSASFMVIQ